MSKIKRGNKINEIEEEIKEYTLKTCEKNKFIENIKKRIQREEEMRKTYEMLIFRKMKYREYIGRLRTETNLVNNIKKKYKEKGKEIVLIYGDWSRKSQMKGCISMPNIGLKRMLGRYFKILNIDEFRTSKIDHYTFTENNNPIITKEVITEIKNEKNKMIKTKVTKNIKLHAVLESTTTDGLKRFQNRNRNSVLNMKLIFNTFVNEGIRHPKFARPK